MKSRSSSYSEVYYFEVELPKSLDGPIEKLRSLMQEKLSSPDGNWQYEVDFVSEMRPVETEDDQFRGYSVSENFVRFSIRQYHLSWECRLETISDWGLAYDTPMSELVKHVLDGLYEKHAYYTYQDSAEAMVEDLRTISVSGETMNFICTGWEGGD